MKHHVHKIILFLVTLSFLFTGCSASTIGLKMADQIKEHTSSSTDSLPPQDVTPSDPAKTDDNTSLPITFSVSHAGDRALGVSVNQVRVIRQLEELPSTDGFIDSFASAYGGDPENPTHYEYPDLFCADGSMHDGIYMVLLDVTVSNPDGATSRYQNINGDWVNHYEDPYLFQAQTLCRIIDSINLTDSHIDLSYFSGKTDTWKNPDAFFLGPGEEKSFQLGFLVGYQIYIQDDQIKGTPILPESLLLWALLEDFSTSTWELHLQ